MATFRDVLDTLTDILVDVFGLPDPPMHRHEPAHDDECAHSPDGWHGAYVGRVIAAHDGVALVVRCGYCNAGRVGDFAIDSRLGPITGTISETRIRNRTGRHVWLVLNGERFDFDPDPDATPPERRRLADGGALDSPFEAARELDRVERARGRFVDL